MAETAEAEFCAYVAARQHALLRVALLLTGNQHNAEDLVQTALAKAYLAWGRSAGPASSAARSRPAGCERATPLATGPGGGSSRYQLTC